MTLPNKLTMLRILLIPVMVIVYYISSLHKNYIGPFNLAFFIIGIIFIVASLTDMLDGMIARKYNLITTFGKFADPLADKMLVFAAMILLLDAGVFPSWIVITIIVREFMVSGIRMLVVEKGVVIAAGFLGKLKTVATMIALIFLLFAQFNAEIELQWYHNVIYYTGIVFMYIALILTVVSGIEYFYKSRKVVLESV